MEENILMLYSGGADSRLMLEMAKSLKKTIYCVLIDYGQKHKAELDFAINHLEKAIIDYQVVSLSGLGIESALTGNGRKSLYPGVSEWWVPGRNLMFVSIAASIAEMRDIETIWFGADYSDREALFPDCYQDWVLPVNEVLKINGSKPISLHAPLLGMTKEIILETLKTVYNVSRKELFSGYGELEKGE